MGHFLLFFRNAGMRRKISWLFWIFLLQQIFLFISSPILPLYVDKNKNNASQPTFTAECWTIMALKQVRACVFAYRETYGYHTSGPKWIDGFNAAEWRGKKSTVGRTMCLWRPGCFIIRADWPRGDGDQLRFCMDTLMEYAPWSPNNHSQEGNSGNLVVLDLVAAQVFRIESNKQSTIV